MSKHEIKFEGLTDEEILSLSKDEVNELILFGEPLVFRAGSAVILGSFKQQRSRLILELAQIEGGGEGVLAALAALSKRYARLNGFTEVEWVVHAVTCAKPNPKLRRVLERRGFIVRQVEGIGEAYHFIETI